MRNGISRIRFNTAVVSIAAVAAMSAWCGSDAARAQAFKPVGTSRTIGAPAGAKIVKRLQITEPGVYENLIVDGEGASGNLVKITAPNVTLRNCEIRNAAGNGVGVFASPVRIENCRIHHMLAGSFGDQKDAHGITGRWGDVVIRNCDISYTSGDSIQFDPDRASGGKVMIEDCRLWTGPLPADAAGFKKGERPGENGVDTKTRADGPRCELVIKNCHVFGWNQPAQINNCAALNLKENVDAVVTHCVFSDNEIGLRVRGPGSRGGAHVTVVDCAVYQCGTGIRAEDKIEQLQIDRLAFGVGVTKKIQFAGGKPSGGGPTLGDLVAPGLETLLRDGFAKPK
jgi:hypothetical protein